MTAHSNTSARRMSPLPWRLEGSQIYDARGLLVAVVQTPPDMPETLAWQNRQLLASAPIIAYQLQRLVDALSRETGPLTLGGLVDQADMLLSNLEQQAQKRLDG